MRRRRNMNKLYKKKMARQLILLPHHFFIECYDNRD